MLNVEFHNKKPTGVKLIYVVIVARYDGKWVFVRHKERSTYEVPGGHIEDGEEYVSAAKRELYEETGAVDFSLDFISVYTVGDGSKMDGGYLFFADIKELAKLPEYEMAEVRFSDHTLEDLTYPLIQPYLFERVKIWLDHKSV